MYQTMLLINYETHLLCLQTIILRDRLLNMTADSKLVNLGEWHKICSAWYRKRVIYTWKDNDADFFRNQLTCSSQMGGPIACVRNEKVLQEVRNVRPNLYMMTSAGSYISKTSFPFQGLVEMHWTSDFDLITIFSDGIFRRFSLNPCTQIESGYLHQRCRAEGLAFASFFKDSCIGVTLSNSIICIRNILDMSSSILAPLPPKVKVTGVLCLTQSETPQALISTETGELYLVDVSAATSLPVSGSSVVCMAQSSSGAHAAILTADGEVAIFSVRDFSRAIDRSVLDVRARPSKLVWCGDDCVAAVLGCVVVLGGFGGDWLPLEFKNEVSAFAETDGLRIVGPGFCQILQRAVSATESVFGVGSSSEPASVLCFAFEKFSFNDVATESAISSIRGQKLELAVAQVAEAAAAETPLVEKETAEESIKVLLQAAVFGRRFVDAPAALSRQFVKILASLKICMTANNWEIPVSVSQLNRGGVSALIAQMAARGLYVHAGRIAAFADASPEAAFRRWGVQAIRSGAHLTDAELLSQISSKKAGRVNLAPLAREASACSRAGLAVQIMNMEKVVERRVKVLLELGHFEDAVAEAASTDLLISCVFAIGDEGSLADLCVKSPRLLAAVRDLYLGTDRPRDFSKFLEKIPRAAFPLAQTAAWHSLGTPMEDRGDWLKFASDRYNESLVKDRESTRAGLLIFGASALTNASQLVRIQQTLDKNVKGLRGKGVTGRSLYETIRKLLVLGEVSEAEQLRAKFKVEEARYCRIMIRSLCEGRQFDKLADICTVSPPVCGFEPVIEELMVAGQHHLAARFVSKVKDSKRQAELYEQLGRPEDAALVLERAQASQQGLFSSITNVFWGR